MAEPALTNDQTLQHDWKRHDDGESIDIFAHNPYDPHNGPVCERCGEGFCHHCEPNCYRYICPLAPRERQANGA